MKICYISSSGGHFNELNTLVGKVDCDEYYYVTSDNAYVKSALKDVKVVFVDDVKRNPFLLIMNTLQSIKHIRKHKPDVIITTGAGIAVPTCYIAKLLGKKVIFIESFSRVYSKSFFGKAIQPVADKILVQWEEQQQNYKDSIYVGPLFDISHDVIADDPSQTITAPLRPHRDGISDDSNTDNTIRESIGQNLKADSDKRLLFVTVGTSYYNFSRLLRELDRIAADIIESTGFNIIAQIGNNNYVPQNYKYHRMLDKDAMQGFYQQSSIVICHAGVGSIVDSLGNGCKTIVVPRYKRFGEAANDHQLEITRKLQKIGAVEAVYDITQLKDAIHIAASKDMKINFRKGIALETINTLLKNDMHTKT